MLPPEEIARIKTEIERLEKLHNECTDSRIRKRIEAWIEEEKKKRSPVNQKPSNTELDQYYFGFALTGMIRWKNKKPGCQSGPRIFALKADHAIGASTCPLPKLIHNLMGINIIAVWNRHYLMPTRKRAAEEMGFQEPQQSFSVSPSFRFTCCVAGALQPTFAHCNFTEKQLVSLWNTP
jgi:hypothetical protein